MMALPNLALILFALVIALMALISIVLPLRVAKQFNIDS